MPHVFLSYDRRDVGQVKDLERALVDAKLAVWRDQERLYAGQHWPGALGEAVDSCDAMILVWSRHASESRFVKLEWNAAIALGKEVLPYLLDDTQLPPVLMAFSGVSTSDDGAVDRLLDSLRRLSPVSPAYDPEHTRRVIQSLQRIETDEIEHAVSQVHRVLRNSDSYRERSPEERTEWETWCPGCFEEKGLTTLCRVCGHDEEKEKVHSALSPRTIISGQYILGKVLGRPGGFGISYMAWDRRLKTRVALKEFFPRDLVARDVDQSTISPHSGEEAKLFEHGLEYFMEEASTLARFDHLNVVRVRTVVEQHETAYLVMDYYSGMTLDEYLSKKGGKLEEAVAVDILVPILDGLREVHRSGFLHRDLKPQNIYLASRGRPILLDFGAARQAVGERSRSLTSILTPGFAPFEQYHRRGDQGPWTDIYAAGATLYTMLTGTIPCDATERIATDKLRPPDEVVPVLSARTSSAVMRALALKPTDRVRNAHDFLALLLPNGSRASEHVNVKAGGNGGAHARPVDEVRDPADEAETGACPPAHLIKGALSAVLVPPLGALPLWYGLRVKTAWRSGNLSGAKTYSKRADDLGTAVVIMGVILWLILFSYGSNNGW